MFEVLTKCPLFKGLSSDRIEGLLKDREYSVAEYRDGDVIAQKDTAYSGLMIILKGEVSGETVDPSGKKMLIDHVRAPQLIAPAFLFGGYNRLPLDIIAREDVIIMTLHRGLLFELMQDNIIIMSNFIDIISNRANLLTMKMYYLSFKTVREKMVNYILERTSEDNPSLDIVDINTLVEYFNASSTSINSVIKDLCKHGVIKYDGTVLTVLDREALSK